MSRMFPNTTRRSTIRNVVAALIFIVPTTAFALDNGNMGVPQNDCERGATADYNANLANCDSYLAGDDQAILQCREDASYEYLDAIATCKGSAALRGKKLRGKLEPMLNGYSSEPAPASRKSAKHHFSQTTFQ